MNKNLLVFGFLIFVKIGETSKKFPLRAFVASTDIDNDTAHAIIEMLRLAEMTFNALSDVDFDVLLGTRDLPPMEMATMMWNLNRIICDEMKLGYMLMLAGTNFKNYGIYEDIANHMKMPLIDWEPSKSENIGKTTENNPMIFSVAPSAEQLLIDYIQYKGWRDVVYIHDGKNADRTLRTMFSYLHEKSPKYQLFVDNYVAPSDEEMFKEFLNEFHRRISTQHTLKSNDSSEEIDEPIKTRAEFHDVYRGGFSNTDSIPTAAAFAHDAILVAGKALQIAMNEHGKGIFDKSFVRHQLFNRGRKGLYCRPHEDQTESRQFETFEHGKKIAEAIKKVVLTDKDGTLTGRIQFDKVTGKRTNFSAEIVEIKPGVNSLNSIWERFQWAEGEGFLLGGERYVQEKKKDSSQTRKGILPSKPWQLRFNVVTVLVKPFVMLKRRNPGEPELKGNDRFEGYCIDLLNLLAKNITGFEYDVFISDGNKYGSRQADGSWDGMIGYLLNETADVAVAPLTITQERERAVDFSKPFMTTGISIMIKKPEKQEFNIFSFMEPLGMTIWIFTLSSYFGVSLTIFLVSWFSPYEKRIEFKRGEFTVTNEFTLYNSLWFTLAAFMQQGTDILPRAVSGRIASSCWWFFTLIIVSSYTANLAAFLTLERMTPPIESVEDLANQNKILYGVNEGGSTAAFFEDSIVPLYKKMWNFMVSTTQKQIELEKQSITNSTSNRIFVSSYADGIEKVRTSKGKYAFLLEETTNNYESGRRPCDTMKVGQNLNTLGYGIATKIGNPLRVSLNLAILYLSEKGELKKLENKWWYDRGQCDTGTSDGGTSSSLNLSKVAGIFYILLAGMVLSMCTALVEFLFRKNKENREKERNRMRSSRPLKPGILASCERAKQKQLQNRRTKSEEVSTPRSTLF
ncbi:Glutamate receptor 2 [Caenorhabditis elegans]|uniref:Isoform a of Glutamate receptor 2 n=1 Tax=Caenorhabditis elegans TaxID=6239 RepID=Q10914-2|nr:Glutamate receptor 2 [Caenorhabditis elegans]CCD61608.1 Glutamate receptor 2 [Caenorhabditis elegans]|eukprot:NP_001021113.1 Glutamate receptor 2 [Caenorhabditis elegans]